LEELGVEGEIILKLILQEIGWKGVAWIDMAQDREEFGLCNHGGESLGSEQYGKLWTI
jgi:hypothetical protein